MFLPSFLHKTLCEDLTWKRHVKIVLEVPHVRMMEMRMGVTWTVYPTNPEITVPGQQQ